MFFMLSVLTVMGIYVLAAVFPALFLMRYIYHKDTMEREPPELLKGLVLKGISAALAALVLEMIGVRLLSVFFKAGSRGYIIALAFFVVAAAEEGAKFFFLKRRTWHDPNFNYRFDGIVYAVFVSLGFAAFENIRYVMSYGLTVALPRAVLAIPGHMGFAVFMGAFYGRAKLYERYGNKRKENGNLWAGYLVAVLLHGFYNACLMMGTALSTALFVIFVVVMYIVVILLIKKESAYDRPL